MSNCLAPIEPERRVGERRGDASPDARSPSHLRAIRPELRDAERYDPPFAERRITNLSLNEHHAPPPRKVVDALAAVDPAALTTYDTEHARLLRDRIALREGVNPENVLLCAGSSAGLLQLFSCIAGGPVLLPSIVWSYYPRLARLFGMQVLHYDLPRVGDTFAIDARSLQRSISEGSPGLVVFIEPHMPTGAACAEQWPLFAARAAPSCLVLVDEAYEGFGRCPSFARRVVEYPNLIVSKTFSKYFGLASLRVGYLVADESVVAELEKTSSPFSMPLCSSIVALAALSAEDEYRALSAEMAATREGFRRRVGAIRGAFALASDANFVIVELPSERDAKAIEDGLRQNGIAVRSAAAYGMPRGLRIGIGTPDVMDRVAAEIAARLEGR